MTRRRKVRPVAADGVAISPAPFVGLGLLAAAFFLYAAAVVLAPWWIVLLGLLGWLILVVLSVRWWEPAPRRLPWLGVTAIVVWAVMMIGGGIAFHWHGLWTSAR